MVKDSISRIPASRFKAECLAMLDRVERTRRPIVVTKRGRAVAKVVPLSRTARSMRGRLKIIGDIVASLGDEWNADR